MFIKNYCHSHKTKSLYVIIQLLVCLTLTGLFMIKPLTINAQITTPTPTATVTATPVNTLVTQTASPSATGYEMPESGFSMPTIFGITIGLLLLLVSIVLSI